MVFSEMGVVWWYFFVACNKIYTQTSVCLFYMLLMKQNRGVQKEMYKQRCFWEKKIKVVIK